jgi:DNA-binding HxlR family transcriptional regulator
MESQLKSDNMCLKPLKAVFSQLGRTWTVPIVIVLGCSEYNPRYHEINEKVCNLTGKEISDTMLSKRLSDLSEIGIVKRVVLAKSPPQVQYHLTEAGKETFNHIVRMKEWARDACHTGNLNPKTCI